MHATANELHTEKPSITRAYVVFLVAANGCSASLVGLSVPPLKDMGKVYGNIEDSHTFMHYYYGLLTKYAVSGSRRIVRPHENAWPGPKIQR